MAVAGKTELQLCKRLAVSAPPVSSGNNKTPFSELHVYYDLLFLGIKSQALKWSHPVQNAAAS